MAGDAAELSEREREVLRLILRGHDAKSIARECRLTIHVVNERLRSARRKLGASSSREAARLLDAYEGPHPNSLGPNEFGIERSLTISSKRPMPDGRAADARRPVLISWSGAVVIAIAIIGAVALATNQKSDMASSIPRPTPPRVVMTSPAQGAAIAPGPLILRVTFDRPMRPGNYSFVQTSPETYPECGANQPDLSRDRRTFTLRCTVKPGRSYEVWFNRPPYMNFKSENGMPAEPFQLRFRTAGR